MDKPLQIGITGGIGSGKSIICRIFSCLGIAAYDADSRAKEVMTTDGILISHIQKEFGRLSYHVDGSLNRAYLSEVVFNNPERLKVLNELVHPRVGEDYKLWLSEHQRDAYVIKEAALLFETGSYKSLDKIIVVSAPERIRMNRVLARDTQRNKQQVEEIMKSQLGVEEKMQRADYIIVNDESRMVVPQVLELHAVFQGFRTK